MIRSLRFRSFALATVAALSITTVLGSVVRAQDPPAAPGKAGKKAGKAAKAAQRGMRGNPLAAAFKAVNPTAEQQSKFDALVAASRTDIPKQLDAITEPKMKTAKRTELTQKLRADTAALLTPEQAKQFQEEYAVASVMQRLAPLRLTADETAKIKPAIKETAVKVDAVMVDTTLKGKERTAKMEPLAADLKAKIKPLLTAEQQTQLESMNLAVQRAGGGNRANGGAAPKL